MHKGRYCRENKETKKNAIVRVAHHSTSKYANANVCEDEAELSVSGFDVDDDT